MHCISFATLKFRCFFSQAYEITKKHVCISVTASAAGGSRGSSKLLLNHISTPHVLLRSAVAASCALPGIMAPNKLLCKNADGEVVPFEVDGDNWVDGTFEVCWILFS
jgi:TAG lipase/steryl ester hydrolase/phospholipase A2/LPA acyltransferase